MDKLTPIEQKTVLFCGAELVAVKASDSKIYAGVRWVCNGLGMDENKRRAEYIRLGRDVVLTKGVKEISLPTAGGPQATLCIELDYLPLWLAKINANIIDDPGLQERLIQYQLKAKDVLAAAFVSQITYRLPQSYAEALRQLADTVEQKARLEAKIEADKPKVEFYDAVAAAEGLHTMNEAAKLLGLGPNKLFALLRGAGILLSSPKNVPRMEFIRRGYFVSREKTIQKGAGEPQEIYCQTYVTGKGLQFLERFVKEHVRQTGFPGHRPGGGKSKKVLRHEYGRRADLFGGM